MNCLAIITARGGSKGLPGKNIKLMAGKPMIVWTIEAARQAQSVARVCVSTDDAAIASVSRDWGAEVPFLRPVELARDDTPGIAPVLHAVKWMEEHEGYRPDYVMLLQPTSPLRTAQDITSATELAESKGGDSVVSVSEVKHHPCWAMKIQEEFAGYGEAGAARIGPLRPNKPRLSDARMSRMEAGQRNRAFTASF